MDQSSKEKLQDFWRLGNNKVSKPLYLQVKGNHYPLDKNLGRQKKHIHPRSTNWDQTKTWTNNVPLTIWWWIEPTHNMHACTDTQMILLTWHIYLTKEYIKQLYVLTCVSEVRQPHSGCIMRGWSPSLFQYSAGGPRTDPCVADYHPEFGCGPDLTCCNLLVYSSS
jgi:hypothetical protein